MGHNSWVFLGLEVSVFIISEKILRMQLMDPVLLGFLLDSTEMKKDRNVQDVYGQLFVQRPC